jgi:hypothetical protein
VGRQARRGRAPIWCSPPGTATRSSRATSTDTSQPAARRPMSARSPCTMPGAPPRRSFDLDVHPRIVMQILRHAQFDVTMEVYASASSAATWEALKRLGASLDG